MILTEDKQVCFVEFLVGCIYELVLCITIYRLYANITEDLINERKIDLHAFLNNLYHTGNYYITAPNVFSME